MRKINRDFKEPRLPGKLGKISENIGKYSHADLAITWLLPSNLAYKVRK